MKIENIKIERLFGELNYDIPIEDNKLILVAKNGSGKTTIVNVIYYFLLKQWIKLLRYRFDRVTATINGHIHSLTRKEIDILGSEKFKRLLKRYPPSVIEKLNDFVLSNDLTDFHRNPVKFEMWAERLNLPMSLVPMAKKFIVDIINNPYCKGLLSVTQSPFIFDETELVNTHMA